MDRRKIETSAEVWAVIKARHHKDLIVFGTVSCPDGDPNGNSCEGYMYTEYGFRDSGCPLMAAESRWDINHDDPYARNNERHQYWLCAPVEHGEGE